jgi:hypothetical protein
MLIMTAILPTKLSDSQIKQFQDLYFKKYAKTISLKQSEELGLYLMRLIYVVYR